MKPVEQTMFYPPRGNCVAAAIASIFELDLGDIDIEAGPSFTELCEWTNENFPSLQIMNQDFCRNYRIAKKDTNSRYGGCWEYDLPKEKVGPPHSGYWMATAISPRGLLIDGPYKGMPIQHAVVMKANKMVWDPHPKRYMGIGPIVERTWWVMKDPKVLTHRSER